jgi:DNA polymerase
MFIGEAPGFHEDRQGVPFVGQAGKFLDELLASINLQRADVYIANVVKCRPPNNRDPLPGEIEACGGYLQKQLEIINPQMVVTLGRFSMARYFPGETIGRVHGKARRIGDTLYFAMYHPAAALHQPALRATLLADMQKIPRLIELLRQSESSAKKPDEQKPEGPTQLGFL